MKSNIIALNSARPERWMINVNEKNAPFILCFYNERAQTWVGAIDACTMDELSSLFGRARNVMRTARAQNKRMEVPV